jgi:hypothetical protein
MTKKLTMACQSDVIEVPLGKILPTHLMDEGVRKTVKYKCIEASIRELGLIEPLVVYPQSGTDKAFILLDGHIRLVIHKELGHSTAKCLISLDDEGFTYNHKVNRLSAVQEHFMILRAIKSGVSEDRIARSLNIDVSSVRQKRDLLDGICPEAVHLLRDKRITSNAMRELRKVAPMRQVEIAELMCAVRNFSGGYAKCLVTGTADEQLATGDRPKEGRSFSPEDIARIEHETESLVREFKLVEESHGKNVLNLTIVVAYLRKLLDNARVVRYLSQNDPEILAEFQKLVETRSLADSA